MAAGDAAATLSLQNPTLKWKTHLPYQFPTRTRFTRINIRKSDQLSLKCDSTGSNNGGSASSAAGIPVGKSGFRRIGKFRQNTLAKTTENRFFEGSIKPAVTPNPAMVSPSVTIAGIMFVAAVVAGAMAVAINETAANFWSNVNPMAPSRLKTSLLKLQVGLLSTEGSLRQHMNWISKTANTLTSDGLHYVLTETIVALLRHTDYCISASSTVDVNGSTPEWQKRFQQLCIEERGNFRQGTFSNINKLGTEQSSAIVRAGGSSNKYIVITIIVAAVGMRKLPYIRNHEDMKEALLKLAFLSSSEVQAVKVLWNDTLSDQQLLQDYPSLRPL